MPGYHGLGVGDGFGAGVEKEKQGWLRNRVWGWRWEVTKPALGGGKKWEGDNAGFQDPSMCSMVSPDFTYRTQMQSIEP